MKKYLLILILIPILIASGIQAQSGGKKKYYKPENFTKRVTTVISKKQRHYYSLSSEQASLISLRGPGKLRIFTRVRFVAGAPDEIDYRMYYVVDGGEKKTIEMDNVERAKHAAYKNGSLGIPGELRDFEIELGRGDHSIEFFLVDNQPPVAVRYAFTPSKARKRDWISFNPDWPVEPVNLIARETETHYYRFSMEKPLKVTLNGPTQLRVLTRIENHYNMKGRIHYRIQVKEDGVVSNTYQLSSVRSQIAVYDEDQDLVPGKACEFIIDIPKGKHVYEIYPLDKDKSTVLGRFLIPDKDIMLKD